MFVKCCFLLLSGLSKWVRQLVRHHDTFTGAMQSLESFTQGQRGAVETFKEKQSQAAPQHPSPSTVTSPPPEIIAPLKPFDPQLAPPNLHTDVRAANSESRSSESGIWGEKIFNLFNILICVLKEVTVFGDDG